MRIDIIDGARDFSREKGKISGKFYGRKKQKLSLTE